MCYLFSICLSICMSVYLSVCLSICLSVYLSIRMSVCLTICLSVCLFVRVPVCRFALWSGCLVASVIFHLLLAVHPYDALNYPLTTLHHIITAYTSHGVAFSSIRSRLSI